MVKRCLILAGILALFGCASTYAESADFSIDVDSASLQLTVPSNINIELQPTSSAAVFDSELLTFNVATNNIAGYKVIMSVPQTEMLHSTVATANIPTLASSTTEANFPANKWGYKTTGDFVPVKLSNEDVAWNSNNPTNGTNHTLTLAAKVDGSQAAGIYTNTLTFTVVANPNVPRLTIAFDGNGADGGSTNAISIASGETAALSSSGFTRAGYLFNGWNERANGYGTGYGAGDTYTAPTLTAPQTKTLYAQWVEDTGQGAGNVGRTLQAAYEQAYVYNPGQFPKDEGGYKHGLYVPEKDPNTGEYTGNYFEATQQSDYEGIPANDLRFAIQDIALLVDNQNVCERTTVIGSEAYVLDLRDFTSYHIAKLKDGRCWLRDNLALDPTLSSVQAKLVSNTNASAATISNFINGGNPDGHDGWSSSAVAYESGWSSYSDPRIYAADKNNVFVGDDTMGATVSEGKWKVGVYYNYCAASIGTYCYEAGQGGDPNPSSTVDIEEDVCPAGWRIPTGGNGGEYNVLSRSYDYTGYRTVLRLPQSGYFQNGSVKNRNGYKSQYWSSTFYYDSTLRYMWILDVGSIFYSPGFNTTTYTERPLGLSVRCIAK